MIMMTCLIGVWVTKSRLTGPNGASVDAGAAACARPIWPTKVRIVAVTTERLRTRLAIFETRIVTPQESAWIGATIRSADCVARGEGRAKLCQACFAVM